MNPTITGVSSWHRRWARGQLDGRVTVPCGDCTACCRSFDAVPLTAGFDDPAAYRTRATDNGPVLDVQSDGSCSHLVDGRCEVYARRPLTCRTFDCRMYLLPVVELDAAIRPVADAARRFALVVKEPDDRTFVARCRAAVQDVRRDDPGASLQKVLITALVRLAPARVRDHLTW